LLQVKNILASQAQILPTKHFSDRNKLIISNLAIVTRAGRGVEAEEPQAGQRKGRGKKNGN